MVPPLHPEFAPIAIISAMITFIPLPWHWRARNVATLSIIVWLIVSNIIFAVDALLWSNNIDIKAEIWCDITTKLIIGANSALPAACLCICIHLEHVASARAVQLTIANKRHRRIFELMMCFGLPIVFMALHYVVQGHRFDIIQGYGCRPSTYFSIPALFIVWIPPLILAVVALVFAGLALRHFMVRRLSFAAILNASKSSLTTSRYIRLMLMASLQMVWSVSVTSYNLWFSSINLVLRPWTNWADVHSNFSRIDRYPAMAVPPFIQTAFYVGWWVVPVSTWLFVAFFAFGHDAVEEYKKCFSWVRNRFVRVIPSKFRKGDKTGFTTLTPAQFNGLPISFPKPISDAMPPNPTPFYKTTDMTNDDSMTDYSCRYTPATVTPYPLPYIPYANPEVSPSDSTHETSTSKETTTPQLVISPLTPPPPPRRPRVRGLPPVERIQLPTRPVTYPSQDAYYRGFDLESQ